MTKKDIVIGNVGIDTITCQGYDMSSADRNKMKNLILSNKVPDDMEPSVSENAIQIKADSLRFRSFISNTDHKEYTSFTVQASDLYGSNIQNMSVSDVHNQLLCVKQRLEKIFGITIWENTITVQKVELNLTTVQKEPFFAFARIFFLAAATEPSLKRFDGYDNTIHGVQPVNSVLLKNDSRGMRFYDKSAQVKNSGIVLDDALLRTELLFYKKKTIESAFKTANFYRWDDQLMERVFQERMKKVQNRIMKYRNEKLLYHPVCMGAKETVPYIIARYYNMGWDGILAQLIGYEKDYHVPCLIDIRDIQDAIQNLVQVGIFRAGTEPYEFQNVWTTCNEIDAARVTFVNQWELFHEYFDKIFNINPVRISIYC